LNLKLHAAVFFAGCIITCKAQQVDLYLGVGGAHARSNDRQIETFGDGTLYQTPSLGGVFTDFGVNVFLNKQVGVGWTAAWRWASGDYAGLPYHSTFHTFDAIYQPARLHTRKAAPELRAGIGMTSTHFEFDDDNVCAQVPGCPGTHHFLVHGAGAARLYVSEHIFVRPAVDIHYVHNFSVFGSKWVPRYSISLGYSFGRE